MTDSFKPPQRRVDRVFIHCSASDNPKHDDISIIKQWHLERGFRDVGYHYFIKSNGIIQTGRDIEVAPAAQEGNNARTVAICCAGLSKFTETQFDALRGLCKGIAIGIPGVTFHGHCEVSSKTCPVFDYKAVLSLDGKGRIINHP